jgi:hypothetical protein
MKRLATLDVEILCQGHHRVFVADDVRVFFEKSLAAVQTFKQQVLASLEAEKGDVDRVVLQVKDFEYDHRPNPKQPEPAYLLNTRQGFNISKRYLPPNNTSVLPAFRKQFARY